MKFSFDFVFCVENTYACDRELVAKLIKRIIYEFVETADCNSKEIGRLRARVIGFGDYSCGMDEVVEHPFVNVFAGDEPLKTEELTEQLNSLSMVGGIGTANALECYYAAMNSDFDLVNTRARQCIFLFSFSKPLPLEKHADYGYTGATPDTLSRFPRHPRCIGTVYCKAGDFDTFCELPNSVFHSIDEVCDFVPLTTYVTFFGD